MYFFLSLGVVKKLFGEGVYIFLFCFNLGSKFFLAGDVAYIFRKKVFAENQTNIFCQIFVHEYKDEPF